MTYYEAAKVTYQHVVSNESTLGDQLLADVLPGIPPRDDAAECEAAIAAAHDYRQVLDKIKAVLVRRGAVAANVLVVAWNPASAERIVQACARHGPPFWSTREMTTPEELLDELATFLCTGIEHVGCVLLLPEGPWEWLLLGQRLRDVTYDGAMQAAAQSPAVFPLATFAIARDLQPLVAADAAVVEGLVATATTELPMPSSTQHDRRVLEGMSYFEVQSLALAHGVKSSKRRMSKAYMINELLNPHNNVDKLDCEDKISATHDFHQVQDEINEYLADHNYADSSALAVSWSEATISRIARDLKSSTDSAPFWSSITVTTRVTHKQLRDELTAYLCGDIDHVGDVLILPDGAEDWLVLAERLRDLSYDSYLQEITTSAPALASFAVVKDHKFSALSLLPMPSGWATVFE
ncbi:hypothetical protein ACHHYP_08472 [Achlya hypogyna]|uniref:Uncharacterized protein n=1 Tax=Achlya hypogyna TaxID=1202772 RepID=A0A1V9YPI4_ACHHY|nr:hypothetical protein ACHHYP_08472 [Achlya hypogyna]